MNSGPEDQTVVSGGNRSLFRRLAMIAALVGVLLLAPFVILMVFNLVRPLPDPLAADVALSAGLDKKDDVETSATRSNSLPNDVHQSSASPVAKADTRTSSMTTVIKESPAQDLIPLTRLYTRDQLQSLEKKIIYLDGHKVYKDLNENERNMLRQETIISRVNERYNKFIQILNNVARRPASLRDGDSDSHWEYRYIVADLEAANLDQKYYQLVDRVCLQNYVERGLWADAAVHCQTSRFHSRQDVIYYYRKLGGFKGAWEIFKISQRRIGDRLDNLGKTQTAQTILHHPRP